MSQQWCIFFQMNCTIFCLGILSFPYAMLLLVFVNLSSIFLKCLFYNIPRLPLLGKEHPRKCLYFIGWFLFEHSYLTVNFSQNHLKFDTVCCCGETIFIFALSILNQKSTNSSYLSRKHEFTHVIFLEFKHSVKGVTMASKNPSILPPQSHNCGSLGS